MARSADGSRANGTRRTRSHLERLDLVLRDKQNSPTHHRDAQHAPTQTKTFRATLMRFPHANPVLSPPHPQFFPVKSTLFNPHQSSSTPINPPPFLSIVISERRRFRERPPNGATPFRRQPTPRPGDCEVRLVHKARTVSGSPKTDLNRHPGSEPVSSADRNEVTRRRGKGFSP